MEPISLLQQDITYTPFNKTENITEGDHELVFSYGASKERIKTVFKTLGETVRTKYFGSGYKKEVEGTTVKEMHYIPCGENNIIYVIENGVGEFFYNYKDHLGSPLILTDDVGTVVAAQSFDAWGRKRNPNNWTYTAIPNTPSWLRAYTGHEYLPEFSLINMNGRMYDPVIGRVLSPDNFVQNPTNSQSYNRYSYVWNNPLKYTDPSGDFVVTSLVVGYFLFTTDVGYELQKFWSPIAVQFQAGFGSEGRRIGFELSVGAPKYFPVSVRWHYGRTSYSDGYGGGIDGTSSFWGVETTVGGVFSVSTFNYTSKAIDGTNTSQSTAKFRVGGVLNNIAYENDYQGSFLGDQGDRYRSAALEGTFAGIFNSGFNIFTGDPDQDGQDRLLYLEDGTGRSEEKSVYYGGNINDYRAGILYFGIDGVGKIGGNSELIRHRIQNQFAHDWAMKGGSKHIKVLDTPSETFYYFGTGTGSNLW
ncbi:MAG: RHS repeat-associated protein [Saprospiraceae bacterium]|jgi:RHS repeat-associated protein